MLDFKLINFVFLNCIFNNEGFKSFVSKFMIQMSRDFALPSLKISDQSALQVKSKNQPEYDIESLKIRKEWENNPLVIFQNTKRVRVTFAFLPRKEISQTMLLL